jgi:hypothetical protein
MKTWAFILLFACAACSTIEEDAPRDENEIARPDQAFEQAVIELHDGREMRARIHANFLDQYQKDNLVLLYEDVKCFGFDSLGNLESVLYCDSLQYLRARGDMKAWGEVEVLGQDPQVGTLRNLDFDEALTHLQSRPSFRLQTTWLEWARRFSRLRTDAPVTFYTLLDTLHGTGFSSNQNLSNWEILQPTGVSHRAPEEKP